METALNESFPSNSVKAYSSLEDSLPCFNEFVSGDDSEPTWWVLMDLGLKGITGLAAIRVILSVGAKIKLITVSGNDDELQVGACFGSGVSAFISKGASINESMNLIRTLVHDEQPKSRWLSASGYSDIKDIRECRIENKVKLDYTKTCWIASFIKIW